MKKILLSTSLFIIIFQVAVAQVKEEQNIHLGSFIVEKDSSNILNLFKLENGDYLLLKDDFKGAELVNEVGINEYLNAWKSSYKFKEGENYFLLNPRLREENKSNEVLNYILKDQDPNIQENEKMGYKLKEVNNKTYLYNQDEKFALDPIIYECITPEDHQNAHKSEDKAKLKTEYGCVIFRIVKL